MDYYLATPRYLETPLENPLLFLRINFMDLIIWLNTGVISALSTR